jgi:hypothetical protein
MSNVEGNMIEKKIVVCIGTDEAKHVRARLSLLLIEDGNVISRRYHSIECVPGADLAALRADNEADIAAPNSLVPGAPWPSIPDDEWEKVEKCCAVVHTPDVMFRATAEVEAQIADILQKRALLAQETEALQSDAERKDERAAISRKA